MSSYCFICNAHISVGTDYTTLPCGHATCSNCSKAFSVSPGFKCLACSPRTDLSKCLVDDSSHPGPEDQEDSEYSEGENDTDDNACLYFERNSTSTYLSQFPVCIDYPVFRKKSVKIRLPEPDQSEDTVDIDVENDGEENIIEERSEIKMTDFSNCKVTNIPLQYQPWAIALCTNTRGFTISSGVLVKTENNQTSRRALRKILLVSILGEYDKLKIYSSRGKYLGVILLKFKCCFISDIACWNFKQKLCVADPRSRCIHIASIHGFSEIKIDRSNLFLDLHGLYVDDRSAEEDPENSRYSRLFACDGFADRVFVFSLDTGKLMMKLDPCLKGLRSCSINPTNGQLWVTSHDCDAVGVMDLTSRSSVGRIPKLDADDDENDDFKLLFPSFLAHDDKGNGFVASWHCVSQINKSGMLISRAGYHGRKSTKLKKFNSPAGIAWISSVRKLAVCDCDNKKIKLFHF